jgi:uncharacterized protein (DUF924 family)
MRPAPAPEEILAFWFEEAGPKRWYKVDPGFDALIRRRFGPWLHGFRDVDHVAGDAWLSAPRSGLALVIALDQFSRNIWRGSNAAFDLDPLAREAAGVMIDRGFDFAVSEVERPFLYMPFMHSEDLEDQHRCVELAAERLGPEDTTLRHAELHREVIERFGRFPYRNAALSRSTTPEEQAYLDGGGYAPGSKRPAKSTQGQE